MTKVFIARFGVVASLVLGLSACTGGVGGPNSSAGPPSSSASSSSASPTPSPTAVYKPADAEGPAQNVPKPEKPVLADEFSEQGLDAFTRYWYAAYNYAVETGDTSIGTEVSQPTCSRCLQLLDSVKSWYDKGNWIVGSTTQVDATKPSFVRASNGAYQVLVQFNILAGKNMLADKTISNEAPATPVEGDLLNAVFENGKWAITDIGKPA